MGCRIAAFILAALTRAMVVRPHPPQPYGPLAELVHAVDSKSMPLALGSNPRWATIIRTWCNGSIAVSKTVGLGSNPRVLATMEDWPSGLRRRTTNALAHTRPWVQILHLPRYHNSNLHAVVLFLLML